MPSNEGDPFLLGLPEEKDEHGQINARLLSLSSEANGLLLEFERWLEPQLGPDGDLGTLQDWAAKLAGAVARLAGLLHLARCAANASLLQEAVSDSTMAAAIRLGKFLIPHAKLTFERMGADNGLRDASKVLTWLKARDWSKAAQGGEFSRRDSYQQGLRAGAGTSSKDDGRLAGGTRAGPYRPKSRSYRGIQQDGMVKVFVLPSVQSCARTRPIRA